MILPAARTRSGPLQASIVVPGSKSATARSYVLAALAEGPSVLSGVLDARDTRLMRAALTRLGVVIVDLEPGVVRVIPPQAFRPAPISVGLAGTLLRFLPPVTALADGSSRFDGDAQAYARPIAPLLGGLRQAGVRVENTSLPFTVHGTGAVRGGAVSIDASGSSQFVSGLLLSAARFDRGLELRHEGGPLPSRPHIELTVGMLRSRGVEVRTAAGADRWSVAPGPIAARDESIEPDLINAATFLAAALVLGGSVTTVWPADTQQAADAILDVFTALGGDVRRTSGQVTVSGSGQVRAADLDLTLTSELTCLVAALLALAEGPGRIRGVRHVRGHETDRLAALETELNALGARVEQTEDGLAITPVPLHGGVFGTYADHRMAHAGALLALAVPGLQLDDVSCTTKTLPDFPGLWRSLLDQQ